MLFPSHFMYLYDPPLVSFLNSLLHIQDLNPYPQVIDGFFSPLLNLFNSDSLSNPLFLFNLGFLIP